MSDPFTTSAGSKAIDQREHNESALAKKVTIRGLNSADGQYYSVGTKDNGDGTFSLLTYSGGASGGAAKATDAYGIQAISDDGTYKYFFFEDDSANYYIMRKTKATSIFKYTKGTGGYAAVYVDETHGPSGSPTWADRGATF